MLARKDRWPQSVNLSRATDFPVIFNGKIAGAAKVPAGTTVKVLQIDAQWVTASYSGTVQKVPLTNTDALQQAKARIAREIVAAAQSPSPTPAPAGDDDEAVPSLALPTGKLSDRRFARYLRTKGREIHDRTGKIVQLRGVNIGGWLVTEGWMCGQTDDAGRGALEQLEKRFGPEKAAQLMNAWRDHWFTAKDLDKIRSYGFNVIRVPFGYRNLQDANGKWIRNSRGEIDFARMDWVVDEAAKRNIYVIFDLHTWPGEYGFPSRWSKEGIECRAKMAVLWKEVARHYRENGDVAAFDVINEPEGSPGNAPHHDFYNAIRSQDSRRMIIEEWVSYPGLKNEKWTNVVWSSHYPEDTDKSLPKDAVEERIAAFDKKEKISETPEVKVPVFIGEMKAPDDNAQAAKALVKALEKRGWHWAVWTYKGVNNGGWASFNYHQELKYDLAKDSYEDILKKWSVGLSQWQHPGKPENHRFNGWWIEGFRQSGRGEGIAILDHHE